MEQTKGSVSTTFDKVNIHPLVLLSVVDHYNRVAKDTDKRVVGILLGTTFKGTVDITNSYAVPFEEDPKNPNTWYFDHNYHESMYAMFRKVNAVERVVGWYSTSSLIRGSDLQIHEVVREYVSEPVFALVSMKNEGGSPVRCYATKLPSVETTSSLTELEFSPVETCCAAEEAEEVGVEHVLRGVSNIGGETLSSIVSGRLSAMSILLSKLEIIYKYLSDCAKGVTVPDLSVIKNAQLILALVPDTTNPEFLNALQSKQADNLVVLYVAHITRIVTGLHDLLNNKILNRDAQRDIEAKKALSISLKNEENDEVDEDAPDMDTIGDASAE